MEVEVKDEEVVEIPATSDSDEIIDSEIAEEPGTETDVSEEPSFAELGLPSFEGKSRKEVAQMITDLQSDVSKGNERYGTVANELGKLRKLAEKPAEKPEEKKVDLIEEMPEMTAGEVADFNELYDKNPVKAVLKYGGPALKQLVQEEVKQSLKNSVTEQFGDMLGSSQDKLAYSTFLQNNSDVDDKTLAFMKVLDTEEHLGLQGRPYEELCGLTKLAKANNSAYQTVYKMMKSHPTMNFAEAKKLVGDKLLSSNPNKRNDLEEDVKDIDKTNTISTRAGDSKEIKVYGSVQESFDSVDDT